jgi:hypothetical protein
MQRPENCKIIEIDLSSFYPELEFVLYNLHKNCKMDSAWIARLYKQQVAEVKQ